MLKLLRKIKDYLLIKKSGLFDEEYYCLQYPDVRQADVNPLWHFVSVGWAEGRDPSSEFDTNYFLNTYPDVLKSGMNPLLHFILFGKSEGRFTRNFGQPENPEVSSTNNRYLSSVGEVDSPNLAPSQPDNPEVSSTNNRYLPSVGEVDSPNLAPIHFFAVENSEIRINMITDTISSPNLFGGVATSMILCTLLANKLGCRLRIVTRHDEPQRMSYYRILENNQIETQQPVEFTFNSFLNDKVELPITSGDYFITTSWWTTFSLLKSIRPEKITYLIQEDERSFYPYGDMHLLCSEVMRNDRLKFLVNSELLYNYLITKGFENFRVNAQWFEPSFDKKLFYREKKSNIKKNFFFYARPGNPRNLYHLGCRVLIKALEEGVLTPDEWDIHFVGRELIPIKLTEECSPKIHMDLHWDQYAALIRKMDVGLSLMYTPHPSYPPLDLAASGAVVVTNRFENKQSLDNYSKNIICCNLDEKSLVEGISLALARIRDEELVEKYYEDNGILRDWRQSFQKIVETFTLEQLNV